MKEIKSRRERERERERVREFEIERVCELNENRNLTWP